MESEVAARGRRTARKKIQAGKDQSQNQGRKTTRARKNDSLNEGKKDGRGEVGLLIPPPELIWLIDCDIPVASSIKGAAGYVEGLIWIGEGIEREGRKGGKEAVRGEKEKEGAPILPPPPARTHSLASV